MGVIDTEELTKTYGSHRGVSDVTLAVDTGEVFGFLGPNGAGKTTMVRTLLDLLHPTRVSARIFGLDSRREGTPHGRAQRVVLAVSSARFYGCGERGLLRRCGGQ